jgi:Ca-activated chloride channel family protein
VISKLARPPATRKNLEIILDASGSMKTALGKKTRWTTAHDVLQQVLATLPGDFNVGLRIYGHRESSRSPKTCTDSELVVPIHKLDQPAILGAAEAVKPKGETPLVYSVLQSPADLKEVGGGTVIVITDGEESCHGDPVKAAAQLKASGLDITLNIVGFTVTGQAVQKQLAGFAQATGGHFYAADNGPALARALQIAAVDRFPYTVTDAAGKEVAAGEAGGGVDELPPGEYTVIVNAGGTSLKAEHVRVALAQQTTVHIALKNDQFVLEQ